MRKFRLLVAVTLLAALVAACGGSPTPALPTVNPNSSTVEPSVTPSDENAFDATEEAISEVTAESTTEVAMNSAFLIQVAGDTELTIDSNENATVTDEVVGSPAQGEAAPVLNTPIVTMRYLRFIPSDQSYVFELSFSENTVAIGTFEIGVDNVGSTVGNNVNEDSAGNSQLDAETTAEATDASTAGSSSASGSSSLSPTQASATSSGGQGSDTAQDTNNPDSNAPDLGITERDETLPPIIAARLIPANGDAAEYNLLLGGTLTIDSMEESGISGSFEFQMAPANSPEQTITVSGTFTDVPFTEIDEESLTPAP
jgi:hypothetical protein